MKNKVKVFSKCCGATARVEGGTTKYYVCCACKNPCDIKSPKPSKDKPTNKTKLVESSNKLVDKPVKEEWEESIKDILYQVIPDPQMLYWALNWIKKDIKKLLS